MYGSQGSPIIRRQVDAAEPRGEKLFFPAMRREEIDVIGIVSRLRVERVRRSDEEEPGRAQDPVDLPQDPAFLCWREMLEHVVGQGGAEDVVPQRKSER